MGDNTGTDNPNQEICSDDLLTFRERLDKYKDQALEIWNGELPDRVKVAKILEMLKPVRSYETETCATCTYERNRRVAAKLEDNNVEQNQVEHEHEHRVLEGQGGGEMSTVDLHPCKRQVVITLNAPCGFKLSLDFLPCFDSVNNGWIAGSSNGYLLCTSSKSFQREYYVCNPLATQWVALPPVPFIHSVVFVGFIFDLCREAQVQDQAHEPLECNECVFKVVRIDNQYVINQAQSQFMVETFSSDTRQWTITSVPSKENFIWGSDMQSQGLFFHNGCLHKFGGDRVGVYDPYINKLHGVIPGPKWSQRCCCEMFAPMGLGLCRGSFWLWQFSPTSQYLRFWELRGYNNSPSGTLNLDGCYWFPYWLCNFRQMKGGPEWIPKSKCVRVLSIHPHDPDIVYLELMWEGLSYVVPCNLRTKTLGNAMFGVDNFRNPGDLLTLDLQTRC